MSSTSIRDIREIVREEPLMHRPILEALAAGPLTVLDVAAAIGHPTDEVLIWIMGMRRYGLVVELPEPSEDGYFSYAAVE